MAHQLFSETDDWELENDDQDVRGHRVVDEQGQTLGTVRDMYVDTETETIDRLVLDGGTEIDVASARIENGTVLVPDRGERAGNGITDAETFERSTGESVGAVDGNAWRIRRHAEELRAETRPEQVGEVRIEKDVVEEQQSLDVPVTHEEVEIRRVATDRPTSEGSEPSDHDPIRIPVMAERVDVSKEARVVEEVEIARTARTDTERVSDTVRHEEVDIREEGNAHLAGERRG